VLVTDKLRSYGAAKWEMRLTARHKQGLRRNNRAENSHQPTRGGNARRSASNRLDQLNASCLFMPPSVILSTSNAISYPARRFGSFEMKP
jgi:putative transposase